MYGVAKTVADCFQHRNKIGLDVALCQGVPRGQCVRPYLEALGHGA